MAKSEKMAFDADKIYKVFESMRRPNGAFIASPTRQPSSTDRAPNDYAALWIRDHLYSTFAYWYLGEFEKLKQGVWLIFDLFKKHREKIKLRIGSPLHLHGGIIHAKYDADTLAEITTDEGWGHHQLDAIGLFLHIVADLDFKNVRIIRDNDDLHIIELLMWYIRSVAYWQEPDFGMWEECCIKHSSSIGAVVDGLTRIRNRRIRRVPEPLILAGEETLSKTLPYESRDKCHAPHHNHDCDTAQLSLLWPYNVVTNPDKAGQILSRIINGHQAESGEYHRLLQKHGCNRYWGDDYYRSNEDACRGISAEWPMFKFWVSIIYSQLHNDESALCWFKEGCKEIVDGQIPEAYQNGRPNYHTPLAWAHAIALIAFKKLGPELQKELSGCLEN